MPQVLKPEIADRIAHAALEVFAERGYEGATIGRIASRAGVSAANVYRYHASKEALLDAVIPDALVDELTALLDARVRALAGLDTGPPDPAASALLEFWVAHRHAVAFLLGSAAGSRHAGYADGFVTRLTAHAEDHLRATGGRPLTAPEALVLHAVFDNTRRALVAILTGTTTAEATRAAIAAFWSYQLPGLFGLFDHLRR